MSIAEAGAATSTSSATSKGDTSAESSSEPPQTSGIELLGNLVWGCRLVEPVSQDPLATNLMVILILFIILLVMWFIP